VAIFHLYSHDRRVASSFILSGTQASIQRKRLLQEG
jgi:hypothetical protein